MFWIWGLKTWFALLITEFEKKEVNPNLYSYREIKLATNYFDKENKLGEGEFGVVYKVQYHYILHAFCSKSEIYSAFLLILDF